MPPSQSIDFRLDRSIAKTELFLRSQNWLRSGESVITVESAGEGNMNCTLRIRTPQRSFILKQSRPYVVKYPDIRAPIERIETEVAFYEVASRVPALAKRLPRVLEFDRENHLAMIEDLGEASDLTTLYGDERPSREDIEVLCSFARDLHCLDLPAELETILRNDAMRTLNHAHLFEVPLDPNNGIDLDAVTPGLSELARSLQNDDDYVSKVVALGFLYAGANGPSLLHGDYYPGSFLRTEHGLAIIDPEFAFSGPAEFDLGILVAHLVFSGLGEDVVDRVGAAYARPIDFVLLEGFAGMEIMRRLLGVAQLPLEADLERKSEWLALSRHWIKESG